MLCARRVTVNVETAMKVKNPAHRGRINLGGRELAAGDEFEQTGSERRIERQRLGQAVQTFRPCEGGKIKFSARSIARVCSVPKIHLQTISAPPRVQLENPVIAPSVKALQRWGFSDSDLRQQCPGRGLDIGIAHFGLDGDRKAAAAAQDRRRGKSLAMPWTSSGSNKMR